jgi:hypothetical protein
MKVYLSFPQQTHNKQVRILCQICVFVRRSHSGYKHLSSLGLKRGTTGASEPSSQGINIFGSDIFSLNTSLLLLIEETN